MAVSVVFFSFSRTAQPEAQRPSSLVDDGFLYCILSPNGLQNSVGGPEGPFGRVWLSLPHLVSNSSPTRLISNSFGGPEGPLRRVVDFSTASCLRLLLSPTRLGGPEGPLLLGSGFHYHYLSLTHLISNSWLPVLTELYNSSTPTQSPTQSLEWHVWSSSSGNNCHAVQKSLSSAASVYECIMGPYLVPFRQPKPPTRFLSITGHWNVSLPSGGSLWNGMFDRAEGQYITEEHMPRSFTSTKYNRPWFDEECEKAVRLHRATFLKIK